jgi:hypothetical protein
MLGFVNAGCLRAAALAIDVHIARLEQDEAAPLVRANGFSALLPGLWANYAVRLLFAELSE